MKSNLLMRVLPLLLLFSFTLPAFSQVKIGGNPKENPHSSAVLELQSTDRGLLLPRLSQLQMQAINDPADALVVYNTDAQAIWIYSNTLKQWMPLLQPLPESLLTEDSCEWVFDTATLKVFLVKGYPQGDSIYYNVARKKFVFADKTNIGANPNPADVQFPGKYIFKGTASRVFHDSASVNFPSIGLASFIFELDEDSFALANPNAVFYNGMRVSSQLLPTATQKVNTIRTMLLQVNHSGADSAFAVTSISSNAFVDGEGAASTFNGIQNNMSIARNGSGNVGTVTGYRSNITMAPGPGSRLVTGNVFGYNGSFGGFTDGSGNSLIGGNAYGIFLGNVGIAQPGRNFAFYSNKGLNRFADSTLITDQFFTKPRAVLDVNATSAMIIPSGTTAQRPATGITAMVRNNTDLAAPEYFDGSTWQQLATGSNEWNFDAGTNKVNLHRGLLQGDSVFYNVGRKKFVFADKVYSEGLATPVDVFYPGKFIFKGTASSVYHDAASENFPSVTLNNTLFDVDNDSFAVANPGLVFYNGMRVGARMLPSATQRASTIRSMLLQVNHTGADSLNAVTALASNAFIDGEGAALTFNGFQNNMSIARNGNGNVGTVTGYRNLISMGDGPGNRQVTGNVFGYQGGFNGFTDGSGNSLISGFAYGVFLSNVSIAGPRRNFAFYSNKGLNRLGDSTLITDQFFTTPRAVLDVNATSAMIIPSGTTAQRPSAGVTAMFRNNTDLSVPEFFNGSAWQQLATGINEWAFDGTNKVNLVRGLALQDTIFYHTQRRQFVFSDRNTNTNSIGQDFPVESFGAKYTFKTTASQRTVEQTNGANVNAVYEVDNTVNSTSYNALNSVVVMNPKAFQKANQLTGHTNTTIHAGNDSVQQVSGFTNVARSSGNGRSSIITGITNNTGIVNGNGNNAGQLIGFRNTIVRGGTATTGRVTGNVYGYIGTFSGLNNFVDGNVYGVFLNSVNGGGPSRNFAFYSNKGLSRLGDSVLITDGATVNPRAVLDVNATSAMIVPTGTTAQRPAAAQSVTGMVRYNTDNGGRLESYNGSSWSGILSGGIGIDPANIPPNSGTTVSFTFNGATPGNVVVVSPDSALPNGIIIAWARVSAANTIQIRFENNANSAVNPPSIGYSLRIIQ